MKSRQRKGKRGAQAVIPRPPEIRNTGIVYTVRRRFQCIGATAGVGLSITYANLLDSLLVATSGVAGVQLFDLVRVNEVEIWAPSTSAAVPSTVQLCFDGKTAGAVGDADQHTATSIGSTEPAYLRARPSRRSQASQFQASSANTAFVLVMPVNTVIDVTLTFRNSLDNAAPVALANALVGATAGDLYFRALDGVAVASGTRFTPLGTVAIQ